MGKQKHVCDNCGNDFIDYLLKTRFCSRECYREYNIKNSKCKTKNCEVCGSPFRQKRPEQIFCSVECRAKSTEERIECTCEYCGTTFSRQRNEVEKNKHHYCSKECMCYAKYWSNDDTKLLIDNYGTLTYKQMANIFSTPKSIDEIRRRAGYIGVTQSREWTEEEKNILIENYSIKPMKDIQLLLPLRTASGIYRMAMSMNLKSNFYINHMYSDADNNYLKFHYLEKDNNELAKILNRTPGGIAQHLFALNLHRPSDSNKYVDLSEYIRGRLLSWINNIKRKNNFTCELTGCRTNIVLHHIIGFNLILLESIDSLDFKVREEFSDYTQKELDELFDTFFNIQESYGEYICISEHVHKHFHKIYGYGNNTREQWNEFVIKYYNK